MIFMETKFDADEIYVDGTYPEIEILKIHVNKDGKNEFDLYLPLCKSEDGLWNIAPKK